MAELKRRLEESLREIDEEAARAKKRAYVT